MVIQRTVVSALFAAVVAVGASVFIVGRTPDDTCENCKPDTYDYATLSGSYTVCVGLGSSQYSSAFSTTEKDSLKTGIETYWPGKLSNSGGKNISFTVVFAADQNPQQCPAHDIEFRVEPTLHGNQEVGLRSNMTTDGRGATVDVNPDIIGTGSADYWKGAGAHEIGHLLDFKDFPPPGTRCAGFSVMSYGATGLPGPPNAGCSDQAAAEIKYPKRDDDSDGYSPDDDVPDCDDSDPLVYPDAINTNPGCFGGGEYIWPQWSDYNCDGENDNYAVVCQGSPVLVDVLGNGFRLTDRAHGVIFDLFGAGRADRIPWTSPAGDDAWLALDRNGNGVIDSGLELFGNLSSQPRSTFPNGFVALRVFDTQTEGGNQDGFIDSRDAVYRRLRLWHDANQNGVSEASELRGLAEAGLVRLALDYRELLRRDEFGNWFRFGARAFDAHNRDIGPWAFDVFFDYPANHTPPGPTNNRMRSR